MKTGPRCHGAGLTNGDRRQKMQHVAHPNRQPCLNCTFGAALQPIRAAIRTRRAAQRPAQTTLPAVGSDGSEHHGLYPYDDRRGNHLSGAASIDTTTTANIPCTASMDRADYCRRSDTNCHWRACLHRSTGQHRGLAHGCRLCALRHVDTNGCNPNHPTCARKAHGQTSRLGLAAVLAGHRVMALPGALWIMVPGNGRTMVKPRIHRGI